ncbi:hypothetical protein LOZ47_004857 [Ophidiomyces ophidiicola]|nr:hypothetical protein LOZ47_004857 [Ophidiomyces ophidiicola]
MSGDGSALHGLKKRTMKTPADYGNNLNRFFYHELQAGPKVVKGFWIPPGAPKSHNQPSIVTAPLGNKNFNVGLVNLRGCSSVLVASRAGIWWAHFWETPGFRHETLMSGYQYVESLFKTFVLDVFDGGCEYRMVGPNNVVGTRNVKGIRCFMGPDAEQKWFDAENAPVAFIFTPEHHAAAGQPLYGPEVEKIKDKLRSILGGGLSVTTITHKTTSRLDDDGEPPPLAAGVYVPHGKALFQYDPREQERDCRWHAGSKLYAEEKAEPFHAALWPATPAQLQEPAPRKRGEPSLDGLPGSCTQPMTPQSSTTAAVESSSAAATPTSTSTEDKAAGIAQPEPTAPLLRGLPTPDLPNPEDPKEEPKKGAPEKDNAPKEEPKKEEPKKEDPPKEEPKKEDPPKEEPKKDEPPKDEPKKEEPKKEEPPKEEPKKDEPPKDEPKKDDPPQEEPKKEDAPKEEPKKDDHLDVDKEPTVRCQIRLGGTEYALAVLQDVANWGGDGVKLHGELDKACGKVSAWSYKAGERATFVLPLGSTERCVARAVLAAGGPRLLACEKVKRPGLPMG